WARATAARTSTRHATAHITSRPATTRSRPSGASPTASTSGTGATPTAPRPAAPPASTTPTHQPSICPHLPPHGDAATDLDIIAPEVVEDARSYGDALDGMNALASDARDINERIARYTERAAFLWSHRAWEVLGHKTWAECVEERGA